MLYFYNVELCGVGFQVELERDRIFTIDKAIDSFTCVTNSSKSATSSASLAGNNYM